MLRWMIDRPVTVSMITLVVVVLGLVSIRLLPVSLIPEVDIPCIMVQSTSSNLSAREMEESVLKPMRQQLMQIDGLEDIVCEAKDGQGTIQLSFSHGTDMDYLFIEVNEKIDRCISSLPDIDRPKVLKASATDIPAFYLNITGDETYSRLSVNKLFPVSESFSELSRFAQDVIVKRIEQLPEVAMADISGTVNEEILILPDMEKLSQAGMTMEEFETYVRGVNVSLGNLTIRDGAYQYNVKFDSRAKSAEDISSVWIMKDDRLIQVGDVAEVISHPAKRAGLIHSDGRDAVCLAIIKQSKARMSDLKKSMGELMYQFKADYPQLDFKISRDQTELLEYSINSLLKNIIIALLLAGVVIFLFMQDFRSPVIVALSMPVALLFSMVCFYFAGLSINIISLSGLLIGVGMMTDNAIVLVDNITMQWKINGDLRQSVLQGTGEVMGPMLSSVLTTCAVFVPMVFMDGIAGEMFHDEAIAITIVLLTSYFVTITFIPVIYHWWYKGKDKPVKQGLLEKFNFTDMLRRWDDRWMKWCLRHNRLSWLLLCVSAAGTAICFIQLPKERLPEMTQTDTVLKIEWNEQLALDDNEERIRIIENVLSGRVSQITALVGSQQFVLGHSGDQVNSEASIYLECNTLKELEIVKNELEELLDSTWPVSAYSFTPSGNIFDMAFANDEATLTAKLRPLRPEEMNVDLVRNFVSAIQDALPEAKVDNPAVKTDVLFVAVPDLLALYEVDMSDLLLVLRNSLNGNKLFNIVQGSRSVPVVIGANTGNLHEVLERIFIEKRTGDGKIARIPASVLMRQTLVEDFKTVVAGTEGKYYPVALNVPSKEANNVMYAIKGVASKQDNFEVDFSGSWFSNKKMVNQLILILLVAISLLYIILAAQFESMIQPLIILSEIIIDIFFVLLCLCIFGVSINLMSMTGLIVISGIVINDSILKIDAINKIRKDGTNIELSILTASSRRLKAIIMTSLTTILAVCPFLARGSMGADLQYPMSIVIVIGMCIGTLVSLFVVPSMYYSIYNGQKGE